jgi:AcrR family transcriptional regulator
MSKTIMNTRDKIVDKALKMFNERGIEYVGLRELAGLLDMRVSNITYYFPTKDDLVFEISRQLAVSNSEIIVEDKNITMEGFLSMLNRVFENHYRFRCLLLSFVHVMTQNKVVADAYNKTQSVRSATISSNVKALVKNGYLKVDDGELDFLVASVSLISRFWISEAAISARHMDRDEQINHYLKLVSQLLRPYATAKARKQM